MIMRSNYCMTLHKSNNILTRSAGRRPGRRILTLLIMMLTMRAGTAWGQTDYSGTYFIGSRGYDEANTTSNYYLCPTEPWYFYKATNDYAESDNGMPFLTTYMFKADGTYDGSKAIWILEKHPTKANCYYVIQNKTGRYMVSNGQIRTSTNANRMRVHLEYVADATALETLGDLALFEIKDTTVSGASSKLIRPHSAAGRNGSNVFLVVNNNNSNYLKANPSGTKNDGPNGTTYGKKTDGVIGLYSWEDNARFYLEDAHCATPTISFNNATGEVTIETETAGATIYYTTDNSIPDPANVGGLNPTQQYDPSDKPTISTETTIKAIAVEANHVNSLVASLSVSQVATPTIVDNGENGIIITCETEGATIFYTLDPSEEPATSYTSGTILREGFSNKTIRVIAIKSGYLNSGIGSGSVKLKCDPPIISQDEGKKFTLSATFPIAATLKYSINNENGTYYDYDDTPVPFSEYGDVIYAKATHADYYDSDVTSLEMVQDLEGAGTAESPFLITSQPEFALFVSWINNKAEKRSLHYKLQADINGGAVITQAFTGILEGGVKDDGSFYKISDLHRALFNTINGGIVKNIILDNVSISGGTNVGAICNVATGDSRIYNCGVLATNSTVSKDSEGYDVITSCSSAISGSGNVGGIVGLLDGSSRVINCFSYADVSGGTYVGGIVGYNNVATTANDLQTMVMNCMFYGEVSGTSIAPIYNGEIITNDGDDNGVNNFNYFRLESSYIQNTDIPKVYNCALGAETRFLQRFEFYRYLLNSNRELAAWWASTSTTTVTKDEMMKWVMEPTQIGTTKPYPILKTPDKYASVVNYTPSETAYNEANRNKGRKLTSEGDGGVLHVTIQMGSGGAVYAAPSGAGFKSGVTGSIDLTITDKDYEHYNFNYAKVQLPYYNDYCDGNYTGNRVVTGWKIVSITGGTAGSYSTGDDVTYTNGELTATPYNFADRKCTNKDLYGTNGSNRVFNQGAYWNVPEGVTAITIEPYWGKAVYLADAYWDVVYKDGSGNGTGAGTAYDAMTTAANVPYVGGGERYNNSSTFDGQVVFTFIEDAISSSNANGLFKGVTGTPANQTVYDYAVVLVGNYHHTTTPNADKSKPYTVTSVDLDSDNEPDYSLILRFNGRLGFHPVRYDFLNLIGLGMAQKATGGKGSYNLGIMQPKYWFEVTNTALFRVTQFEYSPNSREKKPIILQGGVIEQWVTQQNNAGDRVEYFHVGGNVWFKEFHRGSHQDNANMSTPHPPVSVTGGDYNKFYLTGYYQSKAAIYDDNAECYINGGRFGEVAGAGMEGIGTSDDKGNITWVIDHADIKEFYGGGINYAKPVHGNIHTIISNSHVDLFCGGPKFGDMESDRTVTTTATNCTFGTYFGAGYGGNSYNRIAPRNHNNIINFPHNDGSAGNHGSWNEWLAAYYKQDYGNDGVSTQFDYQFLPMSSNTENVARIFVEYVGFSLATTHNTTSSLTDCTVTGNFYGGGSLGKVDGNVTSTLTDCTVNGSVYGAGFSATIPKVEVMNIGFATEPYYYEDLGTYRTGVFPTPTTPYRWEHVTDAEFNNKQVDNNRHILYTTADLTALGTVNGKVLLNIEGTTTVAESVYGGGEESAVNKKDGVTDSGNIIVTLKDNAQVYGNVFGGGNKGLVEGSATVNIVEDEP